MCMYRQDVYINSLKAKHLNSLECLFHVLDPCVQVLVLHSTLNTSMSDSLSTDSEVAPEHLCLPLKKTLFLIKAKHYLMIITEQIQGFFPLCKYALPVNPVLLIRSLCL